MRRFLGMALWMIGCAVCIAPAVAFWQSRDSGYNVSVGGAAPSASGWDPSGKGTNITLSTTTVTNDTAANINGSASFDLVRGTSCKTTGKWAFEVVVVVAHSGNDGLVGLLDQATAGGAGLTGVTVAANGVEEFTSNIIFTSGPDFSGVAAGAFSMTNGDIFGVQADLTAGKAWVSKNGTSLVGDPVAGTGNPITIANNHSVCPSANLIGPSTFQLVTGTLTTPVTGYSSWGP